MKGKISELEKLNPTLKTKNGFKMAMVSGLKHVFCLVPCVGLFVGSLLGLVKNTDWAGTLAIFSGLVNIGTIFAYSMKYRLKIEANERANADRFNSYEKTSFTNDFEDEIEL